MPAKFFMHLPVKMFHQCFSVRDDDRRVVFIIVIITCYHGHSGHHRNSLYRISAAPLTPQPWKYVDQKPESWSWFSFSPASRFCLLTPSVITFYQVSNIKLFEKKFLLPLLQSKIFMLILLVPMTVVIWIISSQLKVTRRGYYFLISNLSWTQSVSSWSPSSSTTSTFS